MDLALSKEQVMARGLFRQFAEAEVKPLAQEIDETERFPRETVEKLQKFGFKREEIESATAWFNKKGKIAVLLCRCVPVVRSLISVPAGAARMPMSSFLPLTVLGTLAWDAVLILVGAAAGTSWQAAAGKFHYDSAFLLLVAFSLLVTGLPFYYLHKKRKKQ